MQRTKRLRSVMVVVLMTLMVITSACSKGSDKTANSGSTDGQTSNGSSTGSPEKLNLSLWMPLTPDFKGKDYNEKESFKQMEKVTNVHIDFKHVSDADVENQFNLLMASGQLPDMIYYYSWDTQSTKYGNNGALLPLEDLIKQHAPNLQKILDEHPDVKGQITSPEGHIYYLPNLALDPSQLVQMFPQIRQDWLDELKLQVPKTTYDWYNVLKEIRAKKTDQPPFVSIGLDSGGSGGAMGLFAPAFGIDFDFFVEDGKVKYGPYDPRYKDLMAYLNKLSSEKLLDISQKDFPSLREQVLSGKAGAWFGWAGSYMGTFTSLMKEKDPNTTFSISPVLPPVGPNGDQRHTSHRWSASAYGIAVSSQTKHAEDIIKWLDFQYSKEGILLNNFGVEGSGYTMVDGKPVYTDKIVKPANGTPPAVAILSETIGGGVWSTVADVDGGSQMSAANGQKVSPTAQFAPYVDMKKKIPPLQFTKEEADIISPIMADVNSYVKEMATGFINGQVKIDGFDKYIDGLKKMKIDQVLEQYQKAYDRFSQGK